MIPDKGAGDERLLTPEEVATHLQVDIKTVYRWIKRGELQVIRLSRKALRVTPLDLLAFIEARRGVVSASSDSRSRT
jgi:excisionase family DNA binding protein